MIERNIRTVSRVVIAGKNKKARFLGWHGKTEFSRNVMSGETITDCINRTFEDYGLDTSDIDKVIEGLEDDGEQVIIRYRLEVDPLSLLEFLVSDEGRNSGLELLGEED